MPTISMFYGILVAMYVLDKNKRTPTLFNIKSVMR